jgi:D-lactate dehydrogenase
MKMLFFEISDKDCERFKQTFKDDEVICYQRPLNLDSIPQNHTDADIISTFIHSDISKSVLNRFNKLKLIVTRSTGFNHIDCNYAKQKNIPVSFTPTYASITVAEHTFALIFALARKLIKSCERVRNEDFFCSELAPFDLHNKTLGIIGLGNIGTHVAKIAQAFGMKVIAYDVLKKDRTVELVSLEELLKKSDLVSLHLPLVDSTHHFIDSEKLTLMNPSAYLINTARGELIDTKALVTALENQEIAGAALDVLEDECSLQNPLSIVLQDNPSAERLQTLTLNHYLMHMPNVIITPHSAFLSNESMERRTSECIEIITAFKKGEARNVV